MDNLDDDAPQLSIKATDKIRLYREPTDHLDYASYKLKDYEKAVHKGQLFPSITTVLDVVNSPFLIQWAVNMAAKEAINVGQNWPESFNTKPEKAYQYLRSLHTRDLNQSSNRGTRKHKIFELLGKGKNLSMQLDDDDKGCIKSWEQFVKDFGIDFHYQELSCIGKTEKSLKYGGTTDFTGQSDGINMAGDYKCTTLETEILLENGTTKKAKDVKEGDRIVAWTAKKNLHISTIAWVADNGEQEIVELITSHGQKLEVTKEHPILVNRKNRLQWVQAANITKNDTAYLAVGWNHNPHRAHTEWAHKVSPYAVGVIWAILNYSKAKTKGGYQINPNISKQGKNELSLLGIIEENTENLIIKRSSILKALNRNNKNKNTPFMELFTEQNIPEEIFATTTIAQEGFLSGVKEIFINHVENAEECVIPLATEEATRSLQQLYTNIGVITQRQADNNKGFNNTLTVPTVNSDELTKHGPVATHIVSKKLQPKQPTIAIEVEESHTHITNGLITHNTTRSGLHKTVAPQLTAFLRSERIIPNTKEAPLPTPKLDAGLAVHISPEKYEVRLANTDDTMWEVFQALREAWAYYAFDGRLQPDRNALSKPLKNINDLIKELNSFTDEKL